MHYIGLDLWQLEKVIVELGDVLDAIHTFIGLEAFDFHRILIVGENCVAGISEFYSITAHSAVSVEHCGAFNPNRYMLSDCFWNSGVP
jgi:hypothetical protein